MGWECRKDVFVFVQHVNGLAALLFLSVCVSVLLSVVCNVNVKRKIILNEIRFSLANGENNLSNNDGKQYGATIRPI